MLISAKKRVLDSDVRGRDESLGTIKDVLFDDTSWRVRYLVVDTGGWLSGRKVVLHPVALAGVDWPACEVRTEMTRSQIDQGPPLDEHEPVSRQHQENLAKYFNWPAVPMVPMGPFGGLAGVEQAIGLDVRERAEAVKSEDHEGNPHLRSTDEIVGYRVVAGDDEAGHVADLILDDSEWVIRYLVVDLGTWLPGKEVLLAPEWAREVRWDKRSIFIDLERKDLEKGPEFDAKTPVNRRYEEKVYDFYGRPVYW